MRERESSSSIYVYFVLFCRGVLFPTLQYLKRVKVCAVLPYMDKNQKKMVLIYGNLAEKSLCGEKS